MRRLETARQRQHCQEWSLSEESKVSPEHCQRCGPQNKTSHNTQVRFFMLSASFPQNRNVSVSRPLVTPVLSTVQKSPENSRTLAGGKGYKRLYNASCHTGSVPLTLQPGTPHFDAHLQPGIQRQNLGFGRYEIDMTAHWSLGEIFHVAAVMVNWGHCWHNCVL